MKYAFCTGLMALCILGLWSCRPNPASKIPALEKAFETNPSPGLADTLVRFYLAATQVHPDDHAGNLHYLSKAAEVKFRYQKDELEAVRYLNQALKEHGEGQNLTEPVGLMTLMGYAYLYHNTPGLSRNPDDIDAMQSNLLKNTVWIDSSLVRLEKEMGNLVDKAKANDFIQIAETYAALIQATNRDKAVDLLLKAGALAKTIGNPNKAIQLYYNVGEKIPDHPKAPTALFMEAFIYENDLHDLEKAKATYEMFLNRYPNDPDYADDTKNSLKQLGKSPEELVRQFEQNPQ